MLLPSPPEPGVRLEPFEPGLPGSGPRTNPHAANVKEDATSVTEKPSQYLKIRIVTVVSNEFPAVRLCSAGRVAKDQNSKSHQARLLTRYSVYVCMYTCAANVYVYSIAMHLCHCFYVYTIQAVCACTCACMHILMYATVLYVVS